MDSEEIDEICDELLKVDNSIDSQIELYQSRIATCQKMKSDPEYACKALLIHGSSERTENKIKLSEIHHYKYPIIFIIVGFVTLLISLIGLFGGVAFLNSPGASIPAIESSIAASLALYGAGIAILLFGADLFLQTKTDIRDESTNKKMFKDLEKIIAQNRKLIEMWEQNKKQ